MPTASSAFKTGWEPYASVADPILQHRKTRRRPLVLPPEGRRPAPGIKTSKPASAATARSGAPEIWVRLTWEDHLNLLKAYVLREGDANVPLEHEEQGVRLGAWLSRQWAEWSSTTRGGYLSEARKIRLAEAGVVWNGPAPPAPGVVGPNYLNERKWDARRDWDLASEGKKPREFDTTKPKREGDHWRSYSARDDPNMRAWLEKQKAKGLTHEEVEDATVVDRTIKLRDRTVILHSVPEGEPRYIPYGHPPVVGLSMELAQRLKAAKVELDEARARRAARTRSGTATGGGGGGSARGGGGGAHGGIGGTKPQRANGVAATRAATASATATAATGRPSSAAT